MTIERAQQINPVSSLTLRDSKQPVKTVVTPPPVQPRVESGTTVKISAVAHPVINESSQDVDLARMMKVQDALDSGEYRIDSDKIADAMLRDFF